MKYLSLFAVAFLLVLSSCSSKQSKAEDLVKTYLQKKLNDPKSYESVNFSKLTKLKDTIIRNDTSTVADTVRYNGKYEITHTYRAKNALGGTLTQTQVFQIDSAFTEASCCYVGQSPAVSK